MSAVVSPAPALLAWIVAPEQHPTGPRLLTALFMALSLALIQPAILQGQAFRVGHALATRTRDEGRRRWTEPEPDPPMPDPIAGPPTPDVTFHDVAHAGSDGAGEEALIHDEPSDLALRFRAGRLFASGPTPSA
jgi:hypothetical protein